MEILINGWFFFHNLNIPVALRKEKAIGNTGILLVTAILNEPSLKSLIGQ